MPILTPSEVRIEAARKAILKLDKFPDAVMEDLFTLVRTMLRLVPSAVAVWDVKLDAAVQKVIGEDTCVEDVTSALERLIHLQDALTAVQVDIATDSVKSKLRAAFHYVDAQFRSSGAYRSSSMGYTYKSKENTSKFEVAMGVDVDLARGGVKTYDVKVDGAIPTTRQAHGIRFGSIAVEKCLAADGTEVVDEHCDCRQIGVGTDRVVLSGVVCPENVDDADGVVATTKYVNEACANVSRVNQNYFTGFDVVDAFYVVVVSDDASGQLAAYGDASGGSDKKLTIKAPGATVITTQKTATGTAPASLDVVIKLVGDTANAANVKATLTVGTDAQVQDFPFIFRLKSASPPERDAPAPPLYSAVLFKESTTAGIDTVASWILRITKTAANAVPVDDGAILYDPAGLYVNSMGWLSVVNRPAVTLEAPPPPPTDPNKPSPKPTPQPSTVINSVSGPCYVPMSINAKCLHINCKAVCQSDERLKGDIRTLPDAMQMCRSMRGVEFKWHDEEKGRGYQMGVVAQEVREIYPSLVEEMDGGHLGVDYAKLVGLLIEAVKELDAEVARLRRMLEPA
jgi:hypothetical protein